jgi:hypothetical protein
MIADVWTGLPVPAEAMDIEEVTRDALSGLTKVFSDADLPGTGWAALGTGMVLGRDLRDTSAQATRGLMLWRRSRKEQRLRGATFAAITLASVGDRLISQD